MVTETSNSWIERAFQIKPPFQGHLVVTRGTFCISLVKKLCFSWYPVVGSGVPPGILCPMKIIFTAGSNIAPIFDEQVMLVWGCEGCKLAGECINKGIMGYQLRATSRQQSRPQLRGKFQMKFCRSAENMSSKLIGFFQSWLKVSIILKRPIK